MIRRLRRFYGGLRGIYGGRASYTANAVNFDGVDDYLTRGAGLTGAVDSKQVLLSVWLDPGTDAFNQTLLGATLDAGSFFLVQKTLNDQIALTLKQPSGLVFWTAFSTRTILASDGPTHILASVDSATGIRAMYIDDDPETLSSDVFNADSFADLTGTEWSVGARVAGTNKVTGGVADFYFTNAALDLSVESNRRKFISATGKPVPLGDNGELPTGTPPLMFFSGPTANWHVNKGSGGGFTEHGELTTAATSPSD